MSETCTHVLHMSTMIQIRNVPDDLHREAKVRAARAGMSLSDWLLAQLRSVLEKPTLEELHRRIDTQGPGPAIDWASWVREEREGR